jgi:hypothetical protein
MANNQKTYKAFEREHTMFITGKTTIDHKIRQSNNLTFNEYVMLDTIMRIREGGLRNKKITYGDFWIQCGIKPDYVIRCFATLKAKELLFKDDKGLIQVAEKFKNEFKTGSNFEEFWKIAPKGTKMAAKRMYDKAIRIVKHNELCIKYKQYIAFCDSSQRFKKDTSSWLNPASGFIEADWIGEEKKNDKSDNQTPEALDYDFIS